MGPYKTSAKYYDDAYEAKPNLVDLPFYIDFANELGGPVLELGCGTGRVLLPIARNGICIDGLDLSESMLSVLRRKLDKENDTVKSKVTLHHGDIRSFETAKQFALVTIPFRAMQHMYSVSDQIAALKSARNCLSENGLLVFDVFNPRWDLILSGIGEEHFEFEWKAGDSVIKRFFKKESVDTVNLNFTGKFIFRTYRNGDLVSEEEEELKMSLYTYPHLLALFEIVGLKIIDCYGSFSKESLTANSPEMIFVLQKK